MSVFNQLMCKKAAVHADTALCQLLCKSGVVGQAGIEPATISLKGCCSTTELLTHRHFRDEWIKTQEIIAKLLSVQKS